ncbi:MAG: ABC transporter permease [Ardenticatenia bacterium]|nr:ABC transporter permease [Ardenticatenia bacterium]
MSVNQWAHEMRAAYAFVERNINLIKRYWGWEVVWLSYTIANSLAITYIGAGMERISGQSVDTQFLVMYLLIGTLVWHFLSVIFDIVSETIAWERWEGTIEYTLMAPISRFTHLVGSTIFSLVYGFAHTVIILLAVVLFFRLDLSGANLWGAGLVLLAGSISFIGLGIMAAVLPLLFPERGAQMTHVVQALLLLVSGVYYPVDVLPTWLQGISRLSPATYVLMGMRAAILDGAPLQALWAHTMPLLVLGGVLVPLGTFTFRQAEHFAKRTGRLSRDG